MLSNIKSERDFSSRIVQPLQSLANIK
jgi:hypothetical protein